MRESGGCVIRELVCCTGTPSTYSFVFICFYGMCHWSTRMILPSRPVSYDTGDSIQVARHVWRRGSVLAEFAIRMVVATVHYSAIHAHGVKHISVGSVKPRLPATVRKLLSLC